MTVRFTLAYGKDVSGYSASGDTEGNLSSYCGKWVEDSFYPMEHSFVETEYVAATETEEGYKIHTCTKCKDEKKEIIPKKAPEY